MNSQIGVILYADVVGYTRLTELDEAKTLQSLQSYLDLFTSKIQSYNGRKIKEVGDAILAEFASAIDAVNCAIEFQEAMANTNAGSRSEERFDFRIGINLGEITHDRNDIFGGGVNLAARIQDSAQPGAISLSASVYELVKGKIQLTFHDQGFCNFKNISDPVQVFNISFADLDPNSEDIHPASFLSSKIQNQPLFDFDGSNNSKKTLYTGGCLCELVRFEIYEQDMGTGVCHCRLCQKALGAVVNAWAAFSINSVHFIGSKPTYYQSSKIAERGFCSSCGTSLTYRLLKPDESQFLVVCIPALDNPEAVSPSWHGGVESSLPWLKFQDNLPRIRSVESPSLQKAWNSVGHSDPEEWRSN